MLKTLIVPAAALALGLFAVPSHAGLTSTIAPTNLCGCEGAKGKDKGEAKPAAESTLEMCDGKKKDKGEAKPATSSALELCDGKKKDKGEAKPETSSVLELCDGKKKEKGEAKPEATS